MEQLLKGQLCCSGDSVCTGVLVRKPMSPGHGNWAHVTAVEFGVTTLSADLMGKHELRARLWKAWSATSRSPILMLKAQRASLVSDISGQIRNWG